MECTRVEELLPAYLENDLGAAEAALVRGHLASCAACSSSLELYRVLERSLEGRAAEVPSLRGALAPVKRSILPARRSRIARTFLSPPVAGGFALAAAGAAILARGESIIVWAQAAASRLAAGAERLSGGIAGLIPEFTPTETIYLYAVYAAVAAGILVTGRTVLVRFMRR